MGGANSKHLLLTTYELQEFADQANLPIDDVQNLYRLFQSLSKLIKDDGVIDLLEFHQGMHHK